MSLYAEFVQEIMNWQTLEEEDAFVSYEIQNVRSIKCLKVIRIYSIVDCIGWTGRCMHIHDFS